MKIRLNFVTKDLRTSNSIIHMSAHQFRELRSLLNYEWVDKKKKKSGISKKTLGRFGQLVLETMHV